ncbi:MAG: mannonate dehydratase [Bryobacteraceae bacterium]
MKRRTFGHGILAGALGIPAPALARKNLLMHVGGDYHSVAGGRSADMTAKANLEYNLRHGVKHLTIHVGDRDGGWDLDDLKRMRDNCDRRGVTFEAIRMDPTYIKMPNGDARERQLDVITGNIRKAGQVGVKVITHHWTVIPIRRNRRTPGRGGSSYNGFKLESNWKDLPLTDSGRVRSDEYWERITHFLQRAIPAAQEADVRMACHPYDPPGLPFGYQGADNWDSPSVFDAIKRYEAIVDSPYNGFQLCLGTVAEGLKDPGTEVMPIVRYLAERGKIHQIHMRNIKGALGEFEEVYPDEGVMDFLAVLRILRDHQFAYSICPDHMPIHPDDAGGLQAFAFGYGYIGALIQAVNAEV